jgi:two-component system sensor histidine kinase VicK
MDMMNNSQSDDHLNQEIGILRQRIAELEAGNKLATSATYADFLFDNSGETILIIDPYTMKILDANPNAARRLGYQRDELCQLGLDKIELPRLLTTEDAETSWMSSTSGTLFYEGEYRHRDGSVIPVEVSSRLVFWQDRDVLINFARDISWRKEAETALRQMNNTLELQVKDRTAELAAEKEKLEAVLGSTTEAISMIDTEQNIIYVNPAFVTMSGCSLAKAQTKTLEAMFDFSATDRTEQAAAWKDGKTWSSEVQGIRQDGRSYPTTLSIVPMFAGNGRLSGYVTSHQDISRFKALDKAQYSFITNVSHQLRTPLTNIKLYTQLLESNLHSGKAAQYLDILSSQAERLGNLVQDILTLASLDSSQSILDWRPIQIDEMLSQLVEANQERVKKQQKSVTCTINNTIPPLMGDPGKLRLAFSKLIENAIAYTPEGSSIRLTISALVRDGHHWVAINVQDNGPGISIEDQAKVFERFFRGQQTEQGNIVGTGLGLSIAQQIIEAHHGHITLQSKLGNGTTFKVWLPLNETR